MSIKKEAIMHHIMLKKSNKCPVAVEMFVGGLFFRLFITASLQSYGLTAMSSSASQDRDIFCAGRVAEEDLQRVAAATGGTVQTSVNNIIDEVLGTCEVFEEKQVGNQRFNIFSGCPSGHTTTIVLRGGADQSA